VDYAAAWAKHPLRDHPRFRLGRPAEGDNGTTLVVLVGRSTLGSRRDAHAAGVAAVKRRAPTPWRRCWCWLLGTVSDNGRVKPVGVRNQLGAGPPA
jgi:hypothetical protein